MSQIRELLVKNETLNEYALKYDFDKRLKAQEFQRGDPKRWLKIVADVFEADQRLSQDILHRHARASQYDTSASGPGLVHLKHGNDRRA
jgi:hypothetical protein